MKPYKPDAMPPDSLDYRLLLPLVGQANAELARYDGLLQSVPDPEVMLSPLTTQEAVLSSKIEGTQVTMDEVLRQDAGIVHEGEKGEDIQEIANYRTALLGAKDYLHDRPVSLVSVRQMHQILMGGVRGQDKAPGEFRRDQNWIGRHGCTMEQAGFVPPDPLQLHDHLQKWESYMASDDLDALVQTAVMHAQFELIHPFKDGNGRIGRILIPLFLYQKRKLSHPMFYLSEYLESHRGEYYARLQGISAGGDWNSWITFFLRAITEQAQQNSGRVRSIQKLYDDMKEDIRKATHSQYTAHLLDAMFSKPIFRVNDFAGRLQKAHGIHKATTHNLLRRLKDVMILQEIQSGGGRRSAILCFPKLIYIVEGRDLFV